MEKARVYFTKNISPEGLQKVYDALGVQLKGKVGVKVWVYHGEVLPTKETKEGSDK